MPRLFIGFCNSGYCKSQALRIEEVAKEMNAERLLEFLSNLRRCDSWISCCCIYSLLFIGCPHKNRTMWYKDTELPAENDGLTLETRCGGVLCGLWTPSGGCAAPDAVDAYYEAHPSERKE